GPHLDHVGGELAAVPSLDRGGVRGGQDAATLAGHETHDRRTVLLLLPPHDPEDPDAVDLLDRDPLREPGREPFPAFALAGANRQFREHRASTKCRRTCMKSWALVTTPNAWWVPRSLSLVTTNSVWSTQMVSSGSGRPSGVCVWNAGSMLPTAIACSAVAMKTAPVARTVCSRIASCAAAASVITPGSGPSSRIEPARTNGVPVVTSACMMPPCTSPDLTAVSIEPTRRTALMA